MNEVFSSSGTGNVIDTPGQKWFRSVDDYKHLAALTFDGSDFGRALSAFNEAGGALNDAPFDIVPPNTVVVPQEAATLWADWLKAREIGFLPRPVVESRDVPAKEIAELRRRNYRPSL